MLLGHSELQISVPQRDVLQMVTMRNSKTELFIFHNQVWEIYQHFDTGI